MLMVMNLYLVSMVSWTKKWTNKAKIRLNKCHHGQSWFIVKKKIKKCLSGVVWTPVILSTLYFPGHKVKDYLADISQNKTVNLLTLMKICFQGTVREIKALKDCWHTNANEKTLQAETKSSDESNKNTALPAVLWNKQVLMFKCNA